MVARIALLGSLLIAAPLAPADEPREAPAAPAVETVREPRTKVAFPVELALPEKGAALRLAGLGARTRTLFRVKVYAVGLYVDAVAARERLGRWKGREVGDLTGSRAFQEALLSDGIAKGLRLVLVRDVSGEDLWKAFDDALGPRVREGAPARGLEGGVEALAAWREQLAVEELAEGAELVFTWEPGGRLHSRVGACADGQHV